MHAPTLVIVGASGRAAAASARRAGYSPAVVDLFADRDTARLGDMIRCPLMDYPHALPELVRRLPPGPVMYTGGLENHPDVIDRLAAESELLGNDRAAVERVRDSARLRQNLDGVGWRFPRRFDSLPADIPCLVKCRASSGGLRVRVGDQRIDPVEYLEEFVPGRLLSAQFRDASFLGVTEQLAGESWLHAPPFHYAGNMGPVECPDLEPIFGQSARRLDLRGPWGIDFILNESGAYLLEVNPRYTAAVEVLEIAYDTPLALLGVPCSRASREHATGVGPHAHAKRVSMAPSNPPCVGKAVYYASYPFQFPAVGPWDTELELPWDPLRLPAYADIPAAGEPFHPGQPVLTFFAADSTSDGVRAKLRDGARTLDALFAPETNP